MGPRAGLDRCGKSRPPPRFDPRTVHSVASRYTAYDIRPTRVRRHDKTTYPVSYVMTQTSPHILNTVPPILLKVHMNVFQ